MKPTRLLVTLTVLASTTAAQAQFTFTKIADTNTAVPGSGSGDFNNFDDGSAVIDAGQVVFRGFDANFDDGVYLFNGTTLGEVAFTGQMPPGLPTFNYHGFNDRLSIEVMLGVANVGFEGFFDDPLQPNFFGEVVVTDTGGVAINRADNVTTASPSTGTVFDSVGQPGLSGGAVAFNGEAETFSGSDTIEGVYTDATGPLTTVVDTNTSVPGLPTFSFDFFDSDVAFNGNIGIEAEISDGSTSDSMLLLATPGGGLTDIANTFNTLSPSTGIVFGELDEPGGVDGSNVAFGGEDGNDFEGIYTNLTGSLTVVADEDTLVPSQGSLTFDGFDADDRVAIDGNRIAFEGSFSGGRGLYLWDDGTLLRIIDETQMLDGKVIRDLDFAFDSALSGDTLAFVAGFTDGSEGVFTATIPEPTSLALLGVGGLALLRRSRRAGS